MPPKEKQEPSTQEPLKSGEKVSFSTKDRAQHTAVTLTDEADGKVQVALLTSRGRLPALPFILYMNAADLTRA